MLKNHQPPTQHNHASLRPPSPPPSPHTANLLEEKEKTSPTEEEQKPRTQTTDMPCQKDKFNHRISDPARPPPSRHDSRPSRKSQALHQPYRVGPRPCSSNAALPLASSLPIRTRWEILQRARRGAHTRRGGVGFDGRRLLGHDGHFLVGGALLL